MAITTTVTRPLHPTVMKPAQKPTLNTLSTNLARRSKAANVSEIEEYVRNLWCMEADPYRYTTD